MSIEQSSELQLTQLALDVRELVEGGPISIQDAPVLDTQISDDILRGVKISTVLSKFARVLHSQDFGSQKGYLLSQRVLKLGAFISHDWASGRFSKFLALCLHYNGNAAVFASVITAVVVGLLVRLLPRQSDALIITMAGQKLELVPFSFCWTPTFFVFVCFFIFFQEFREILGLRTSDVFLDKCCVDQVNEERKTKAIEGLAGFLASSEKLIVLWSPRYFTRLWCTYELASWLHLEKPIDSIIFVPLVLPYVVIIGCLVFFCPFLTLLIMKEDVFVESMLNHEFRVKFVLPMCLFFFILADRLRHQVHELRELHRQIEYFRIENAQCFCCSNHHVNPETGLEMRCDRALVYKTLGTWFAVKNGRRDDNRDIELAYALSAFNASVRDKVGRSVLSRVSSIDIPYSCVLFWLCPCLWLVVHWWIVGMETWPWQLKYQVLCRYLLAIFAYYPAMVKFCLLVIDLSLRVIKISTVAWRNLFASALCAAAGTGIFLLYQWLKQLSFLYSCLLLVPMTFALYRLAPEQTVRHT